MRANSSHNESRANLRTDFVLVYAPRFQSQNDAHVQKAETFFKTGRVRANSWRVGFTLTELLVVLAIIGVLAALLIPAISFAKNRAQRAQCMGNLHQVGIALQNFLNANQAYPTFWTGATEGSPIPLDGTWMGQLERGGFDVSKPKGNFLSEGVWRCPSARRGKTWPTNQILNSYGYNVFGVLPVGNHTNNSALGLHGRFVSDSVFTAIPESEVVNPSDMMAIGDTGGGGVFLMRPKDFALSKAATTRHQGKINISFCDGHVESQASKFVFGDTNDMALIRWNRDHQPHADKL